MCPTRFPKIFFLLLVGLFLPLRSSNAEEFTQIQQETERGTVADHTKEGEPLRLAALIRELLKANPELEAARKQYEAALARPPQEGALPDPRITAGWIANGWPYPGAGLGVEPTSNLGIQIAQEIPYPGKRTLKGGIAQKAAASEAQQIRARELALVSQLKEKFYDLRLAYESVDLIHKRLGLLQQLAKAAEIRYSVGKAMQQDLIKASVEISILSGRLIALEQKQLSLAAEINTLLGRPPGADLGRPESVSTVPTLEPLEMLQSRALEESPMLRAQQAAIDGRQLNVQLAQKAYYPDFDVMTGYYNQGAMKPMWEFKVQINVPLYFWKKQRYGSEEAGAMLAESQRTYRVQQQAILYRLKDRYLAAQAARKLLDLYTRQIVPQSELALESALASYETGGVDFLSVLSNFNTIVDYQLSYCEQQAEYLKALSALEELTGTPPGSPGSAQEAPGSEVRR